MRYRWQPTKGDRPLRYTAIRDAHTRRRRPPPIQGIPISSCELGVARSVFDAQWFVKQPYYVACPSGSVGGAGRPLGVPPAALYVPRVVAAQPPQRAGKEKILGRLRLPKPHHGISL